MNQQPQGTRVPQATAACRVELYHTVSGRSMVDRLLSRMCELTQEGGVYGVPWLFTTTWFTAGQNDEGPSLSICTEHGVDVIVSFTSIEAHDEAIDIGSIMDGPENVLRAWCIADGDPAERLWYLRSIFSMLPVMTCPHIIVECKEHDVGSVKSLEEHVHHFERLLYRHYRVSLSDGGAEQEYGINITSPQAVAVPPSVHTPEDLRTWMLGQRVVPLCLSPSAAVGPLELLLTVIQHGLRAIGFTITPRTHHPILSQ